MEGRRREVIGVIRELYVALELLINILITRRMSIVSTIPNFPDKFIRKTHPHPITRIFYLSEKRPHSDKISDVSVPLNFISVIGVGKA